MRIHPRYSYVAFIAVCYFQATKCILMGDAIELEHTARNSAEKCMS
jgi:hypothetical protein